jgi:hypothetical protein
MTHLALGDRIRQWQPNLRMIFIARQDRRFDRFRAKGNLKISFFAMVG